MDQWFSVDKVRFPEVRKEIAGISNQLHMDLHFVLTPNRQEPIVSGQWIPKHLSIDHKLPICYFAKITQLRVYLD